MSLVGARPGGRSKSPVFMPGRAKHRLTQALLFYVQRDDCTGLATGGNKTRKLEYSMGKALAGMIDYVREGRFDGANTIVFLHTVGTAGFFAYADTLNLD